MRLPRSGERQRQQRIENLELEKLGLLSRLDYVELELTNLYENPALGRTVIPHLHLVPDLVEVES